MKRIILWCFALITFVLSSCEKPAGQGGDATIKGKIWVEDWDNNFISNLYITFQTNYNEHNF